MRDCPTCGFLVDDGGEEPVAPDGPDGGPSCAACCAEAAAQEWAVARADRVAAGGVLGGAAVDGDAGDPGGTVAASTVPGSTVPAGPVPAGPVPASTVPGSPVPGAAGTAVLDRPAPVPVDRLAVRYRSRTRRRKLVRATVLLTLLGAGVAALVVVGGRGDGPVAEQLVRLGVISEPVVSIPGDRTVVDLDTTPGTTDGLRAELPVGHSLVAAPLEPPAPSGAQLAGAEAPLGSLATMSALSSDLGGPGVVAGFDDAAGIDALAGAVAQSLPGEELSRRDVPLGDGRAVDLVLVASGEDAVARFGPVPAADPATGGPGGGSPPGVTTRVRVLIVADRLVALVTSGVDDGADRLDDAHRRLVDSFAVDR